MVTEELPESVKDATRIGNPMEPDIEVIASLEPTVIVSAQNERNDEEMFFTISRTMKDRGYEFLELTKMVKSDGYRYIMNRHKGADTLPLGAGAGGSVNGLVMMNPIKLEEYEESVLHFNDRKRHLLGKYHIQGIIKNGIIDCKESKILEIRITRVTCLCFAKF